jgi:zinc/manganese transport system ATP-binding protein
MIQSRAGFVELRDLTLGYDRHPAVHHLSGCFEAGSLTAVIGPNGAGKSTLLKAIAGTLKPIGGSLSMGLDPARLAYLPQLAELDRDFPISVEDLIGTGFWREIGPFGQYSRKDRSQITDALAKVGLSGFNKRLLGTLSGGQLQRVMFARLMVQDAEVILIDEPFAAIDTKTVSDLMELVRQWHKEGRTIIAVLHDMGLVAEFFSECLILARECVAWGPTEHVLNPDNLSKARAMIEANDPHADECERAA